MPAILIIGDSTVEGSNNNHINTLLKANFVPYGQNYPDQKATGRSKRLHPSFLDPNSSDAAVITGVNFASAGAGNEYQTNTLLNAIPVPKQIDKFRACIDKS
ncbi:hypothetical protein SADUNF_Sadunf08G0061400 [Salix dunnii]|uniref:Uncharacterized protein n=1 Tax=Salix dunnii TaxID=1413687 RepID=A0A835JYQ4_9ROSI|nr:hypothetical protein SADUNF_Sadunf08G0061400 [Salix dunnii]